MVEIVILTFPKYTAREMEDLFQREQTDLKFRAFEISNNSILYELE
jgi:hypothetical protein